MAITQLPGWYDQIAPYVQQLSNIVPRLFNRNLDAQRMLQQQIAQNPQILQELADLNANTPGIIDKLGFGNISGQIGKIPESYKSKTQKAQSKAVENLTPEQEQERIANLIGISTVDEKERANLQKQVLQQNLQQGEQSLSEGELKRKEYERVRGLEGQFSEWIKTRPGKTNLYKARVAGEVPEWMADAITSSPNISKQYDQDAQDYFREKGLELDRARLNLQRSNDRQTFEEWKRKSIQDQAERMAYRANSTNIDGFASLIINPMLGSQLGQLDDKQLDELAKQQSGLAPAIDAFRASKVVDEKSKQGIVNSLRIAHSRAVNRANAFRNGKASELDIQADIDAYNQRLVEAQGAGVDAGMLTWGKVPGAKREGRLWGTRDDDRPRLILVDPKTNTPIGDGEKGFEVPDVTKSAEFKQQIDAVSRDLVARSAQERKQILDRMAADTSHAGKVAYAQISDRIKSGNLAVAGDIKPGTDKSPPASTAPKRKENNIPEEPRKSTATNLAKYRVEYLRLKNAEDKKRFIEERKRELSTSEFNAFKKMSGIKD